MTDTRTLSVFTLTDLVEVTPVLLGFPPVESLVAVACRAGSVALVARIDLPAGAPESMLAQLRPMWLNNPDCTFLLLVFSEDANLAWSALGAMDAALPPHTLRLCVHADGTRWHATPGDEGLPYDARHGRLCLEAAVEGVPVLGSRDELYELIAPVLSEAETDAAIERVFDRYPTSRSLIHGALALLERADAGALVVDADVAAALCMATRYRAFVHPALLSTTRTNAEARRDLWAAVVRQVCPCCAGVPLAGLGLASWVLGQGAMLVVCLDLMRQVDADPLWSEFLEAVNVRAVHPGDWAGIAAGGLAAIERHRGAA